MIANIRKKYFFDCASEFVHYFKLEKSFKKIFKTSLSQWEDKCFMGDNDIISLLLDQLPDKYLVDYVESAEGFLIYHID